ncbi:hypothetical protein JNUCC64_30660 [Streptomyces sp. JNUCC 64]
MTTGAREPGTRVERTGIALVHEGEYVVAAPGAEAEFTDGGGGGPVVEYHFPVEIEVVGTVDEAVVRQVTERVFEELRRELSSRQ